MQDIKGFFPPYRWLSNFQLVEVELDGMKFPSTENAYQAAKLLVVNEDVTGAEALTKCTPREAKKAGDICVPHDSRWHHVKVDVMRSVLEQKFSQQPFKDLLLSTGECYLEETNTWNDTFWGVCNGVGENTLGKLIMKIREQLRG